MAERGGGGHGKSTGGGGGAPCPETSCFFWQLNPPRRPPPPPYGSPPRTPVAAVKKKSFREMKSLGLVLSSIINVKAAVEAVPLRWRPAAVDRRCKTDRGPNQRFYLVPWDSEEWQTLLEDVSGLRNGLRLPNNDLGSVFGQAGGGQVQRKFWIRTKGNGQQMRPIQYRNNAKLPTSVAPHPGFGLHRAYFRSGG